jgi:hypothetical protein
MVTKNGAPPVRRCCGGVVLKEAQKCPFCGEKAEGEVEHFENQTKGEEGHENCQQTVGGKSNEGVEHDPDQA